MAVLPSLDIKNFRTFRHLRIEQLGRVNLIVGENGVGKTTLLQALRFYGFGSPLALREYLGEQQEWVSDPMTGEMVLDLRALFHGREANSHEIEIGPVGDESQRLGIAYESVPIEQIQLALPSYRGTGSPEGTKARVVVVRRNQRKIMVSPEPSKRLGFRGRYAGPPLVPALGVPEPDLSYWWDELTLTESDDRVLKVLSLIIPVNGVSSVADPADPEGRARMFKARPEDKSSPNPLKSLGEGMFRAFQIAVALEYARVAADAAEPSLLDEEGEKPWSSRTRILLVDEIENGIHFSKQAQLWKAIFNLARQHDVQVFATTHSWDCIRSFQEAAAEVPANDAMLIRLEAGRGKLRAFLFNEAELAIVTRQQIEVR